MPKTYNQIYIESRKRLKEAGIQAYALEARLIVAAAGGKTKEAFLAEMNLYASDSVEKRACEMIDRRVAGEPAGYIIGEWEFYGLPMKVNKNVLIPRVDTEVLAETAIAALCCGKSDVRVIDLCTGSGCIGCAIANELPEARVVLADNSPRALEVAEENCRLNKLEARVSCVEIDALVQPPVALGSFDMLVCNPPYIPTKDLEGLDNSVRDFEPSVALDGGEDGLDFYRCVIRNWRGAIRTGGLMLFEVGAGQAEEVRHLMEQGGLVKVGTVTDTGNIERVVYGTVL